VLTILLIFAAAALVIWGIGAVSELSRANGQAGEIVFFSIIVLVPFLLIVRFVLKEARISARRKHDEKSQLQKENCYNDIKKKHSV
jgi:EamA domain-containing membrane protein RarD